MLRKFKTKAEGATMALTPMKFRAWMANAEPGEWCCYFVGHLAAESVSIETGENGREYLRKIQDVAMQRDEAWLGYMDGRVTLVQKREVRGEVRYFRYFAIRTVPPKSKRHRRVERFDVV